MLETLATVLLVLFVTIVIETVIVYILGFRKKSELLDLLLINCVTNPLLSIIVLTFQITFFEILLVEILIIVIEFLLLNLFYNASLIKLLVVSICINIISFILGFAIFLYSHPYFPMMLSCSIKKDPLVCINSNIVSTATHNSDDTKQILDDVYETWNLTFKNIDRRSLSDTTHEVGHILSLNYPDINEALKRCSQYWFAGCIHGAVMGYSHNSQANSMNLEICDSLTDTSKLPDCIHGIGHTIWMQNPQQELDSALLECDRWKENKFIACVSGILMEYSKGKTNIKHDTVGKIHTIELPCNLLAKKYQEICYLAEVSYREYYPSNSNNSEIYCMEIPQEYYASCIYELNRRLNVSGIY